MVLHRRLLLVQQLLLELAIDLVDVLEGVALAPDDLDDATVLLLQEARIPRRTR